MWLNIPRARTAAACATLLGTAAAHQRGPFDPAWFDALCLLEEEAAALEWEVNSARETAEAVRKARGGKR